MYKILVVDDVPDLREGLVWAASGKGREIMSAEKIETSIQLIQQYDFDMIITDLRLEKRTDGGLDVLKAAKDKDNYTQVIMVTAYGTPEISVETMRLGAYDYLERVTAGTDFLEMVRSKILLALEYRDLLIARSIKK